MLHVRLSPSSPLVSQRRCGIPNESYDVIRRESANYELAVVIGDLLVIHNVAVFTADVIRLSALEKLGLYTGSVSV